MLPLALILNPQIFPDVPCLKWDTLHSETETLPPWVCVWGGWGGAGRLAALLGSQASHPKPLGPSTIAGVQPLRPVLPSPLIIYVESESSWSVAKCRNKPAAGSVLTIWPPTGLDPEGSGEVGREGHPELSA